MTTIITFFSNKTYSIDNRVMQTPMKKTFEEEREHGYCSDSHPTRGLAASPQNDVLGPSGSP